MLEERIGAIMSIFIFPLSAPFLLTHFYFWFTVYVTFHQMRKEMPLARATQQQARGGIATAGMGGDKTHQGLGMLQRPMKATDDEGMLGQSIIRYFIAEYDIAYHVASCAREGKAHLNFCPR